MLIWEGVMVCPSGLHPTIHYSQELLSINDLIGVLLDYNVKFKRSPGGSKVYQV